MAAPQPTAMDKADLKRLLARSKKEPVNCAIGLGNDPTAALLLLDKVKEPKAVSKLLEKQFPDMKMPRWGTAFVDVDENPKLVEFRINKPLAGVARKLIKTLKGTGFSKVSILLEDGTPVEAESGEDEDEAQAAAPDRPQADAAPATEPEPATASAPDAAADTAPGDDAPPEPAEPDAPPAEAAGPDPAALTERLTALVRRMLPVMASDPSQQGPLRTLAQRAQQALRSADFPTASGLADMLEAAIARAEGGPRADASATPPPETPPAPASPSLAPGAPAFAKARQAWVATRQRMEAEIDKLHGAITAAYDGHGAAADLDRFFRAKVDPVLESLDESLAHKLDEVSRNKDPAQHAELVDEARALIRSYEAYLAREPLIAQLDANPFVPLQIQKTLTATLTALSRVVS